MTDLLHQFGRRSCTCVRAGRQFGAGARALESGAHVYVEKPLVESAVEAKPCIDLARRKNRWCVPAISWLATRRSRHWRPGSPTRRGSAGG